MRKIDKLLAEYGESHQNATNKLIHWICVPMIFFSIVGLIWSIPSGALKTFYSGEYSVFLNWATIALVLVLIYYVLLSIPLSIGMFLVSSGFISLAYALEQWQILPLWVLSLGIFIMAWIGQFYGHKVEGKKPSFFKDLQFLLVGPAWLMSFVYKKLGIKF
jgi:uncharacterized membrane protein YGL010W